MDRILLEYVYFLAKASNREMRNWVKRNKWSKKNMILINFSIDVLTTTGTFFIRFSSVERLFWFPIYTTQMISSRRAIISYNQKIRYTWSYALFCKLFQSFRLTLYMARRLYVKIHPQGRISYSFFSPAALACSHSRSPLLLACHWSFVTVVGSAMFSLANWKSGRSRPRT